MGQNLNISATTTTTTKSTDFSRFGSIVLLEFPSTDTLNHLLTSSSPKNRYCFEHGLDEPDGTLFVPHPPRTFPFRYMYFYCLIESTRLGLSFGLGWVSVRASIRVRFSAFLFSAISGLSNTVARKRQKHNRPPHPYTPLLPVFLRLLLSFDSSSSSSDLCQYLYTYHIYHIYGLYLQPVPAWAICIEFMINLPDKPADQARGRSLVFPI